MKCSEYEILINDLADGTISEADNARLNEHIHACKSCSKELQNTLLLLDKVSALPLEIEPRRDLWPGIEEAINSKKVEFKQITDNYFSFQSNTEKTREPETEDTKTLTPYLKYGIAAAIVAACLLASVPFILNLNNSGQNLAALDSYWQVSKIKGSPKVMDSQVIFTTDSVKTGEWIVTDDSSQAMLHIANIGNITIDPRSKVKVLSNNSGEKKIMLEYGTISAELKPGQKDFFVESRSATAFDDGSTYTYTVDTSGDGIVYVKSGLVTLIANGRESMVPAGKMCITKAGVGPGTPYNQDASPELKQALINYDFKNGGSAALNKILSTARKTDATTLINLLPRVSAGEKEMVYTKLASFVPPPPNLPKDSIPKLDDFKELNEWMTRVQDEINKEMEENMAKLNEIIKEQMGNSFKANTPEMQKELQEKIDIYMQKANEIMEKQMDKMSIHENLLEKQMEKLNEHLSKEFNYNYNFNFDEKEFEKEMERAGREIERSMRIYERDMEREQERMERELERQQEQIEREQERIEREQERMTEQQQREVERQQREVERQQEQVEREIEQQQREIERQQEQIEREIEQQQRQIEQEQERHEREQEQMEREQERIEREQERIEREQENEQRRLEHEYEESY
jgi:septal ring factor EnvC (AmiA/AmiB activator)